MFKRWLIVVLMAVLWGDLAWAERDVYKSSDHRLFSRFPFSWIVQYQSDEAPEYRLALGPMKKIDGVIRPEVSERYQGMLSRITYRIPDGHSADEVFTHFKKQLDAGGSTVLFSCSSRQCGSSNQWANNKFRVAELYGVDRTQSYLAAQYGSAFVALYTVKRGNRRVYVHLDILEPMKQTADFLSSELQINGFSWLPVRFVEGSPVNLDESIQPLIQYLKQNEESRILLAGYVAQSDDKTLAEMIDESQGYAVKLSRALIEAGINESRFEAAGVGPLLPLKEEVSSPAIWVQKR
ncbi:MAG: DUF4892 domain-containing protein [Amphritea sp.]